VSLVRFQFWPNFFCPKKIGPESKPTVWLSPGYRKEVVKKNIGTKDRLIRLAIALLLFGYAFWQSSWIAFAAGLFTLIESLFSWCILYQILGKSSCPIKPKK
jgi:hypothetical protein